MMDRSRPLYLLYHQHMKALHNTMRDEYTDFFDSAPANWLGGSDLFFAQHEPAAILMKYGQNAQIEISENEEQLWEMERNYAHIKYVSFALACHIA
jgi:hypothetical protein